ncbi:MAG: hypothetical protein LBE24_01080 [Methylobacillus sp.]|jgi:hypothetical protein|nr:hypothetical protein [Methylobacillus sp.]
MNFTEHAQINTALYKFAEGYLEKRGWFESLGGIPRNKSGVVPWITYPAFVQLERIARADMRVFEYGCGGSSLWWASRVAEVISVEHNAQWAAQVTQIAFQNLKVVVREMNAEYSVETRNAIEPFFADAPELPVSGDQAHDITHGMINEAFIAYAAEIMNYEKQSFDVVVVDGMARALTAWLAAQYVKPDGIIVFDNSDRWQYNAAYQFLHEAGFAQIDFYGPGPVNAVETCTSIFTRDLRIFTANIARPRGNFADIGW